MITTIKTLLLDEDGATMVEYALILALIAIVCIAVITALGTKVQNTFSGASNAMP